MGGNGRLNELWELTCVGVSAMQSGGCLEVAAPLQVVTAVLLVGLPRVIPWHCRAPSLPWPSSESTSSLRLPPLLHSSMLLQAQVDSPPIPLPGDKVTAALASVAQLVGAWYCSRKVAGLIPGHGPCLGCGFSPWSGRVLEATN